MKLRRLPKWNEHRRECARRYAELFAPAAEFIRLPHEPSWAKAVYHLYVVRFPDRAEVLRLGDAGIGTGIHYQIPLHLQNAYRGLGFKAGDLPVSEESAEILSLPMSPQLDRRQQQRVAEIVGRSLLKAV